MSVAPTNPLSISGQLIGLPTGPASKSGMSSFGQVLMRKDGQSEKINPQGVSSQIALVTPAALTSSPLSSSGLSILTPKLESTGNTLSALSKRVSAIEETGNGTPLQNRLQLFEVQFRQVTNNVDAASGQTNPLQLLKLQQDIYQIEEQVELLSKAVEQTTGGIKSVLQTQI